MYVELTCKSNFSFLRGASDAREYIRRANDLGMKAIGICDINGVYGLPRAYELIRTIEEPVRPEVDASDFDFQEFIEKQMAFQYSKIKLICGSEVRVKDRPPISLIVRNRRGWGLLCRIITQAHSGKIKGDGAITYEELEFLTRRFIGVDGLYCIVTNDVNHDFDFLKRLFGTRLYISLTRYLDGLDRKRTATCLEIASKHLIPIVASNDVHYHEPLRRPLQDCLTCIREGTTLDKAGLKLFPNAERYLKSSMQMELLFSDMPDAIYNTAKIADDCTFCLSELKYTYPKEALPEGLTAEEHLRNLVIEGAKKRYKSILSPEVDARIRKELTFFSKRNQEDYFITMHDILKEACDKKIVFQGRGSAASSITAYALGITAVDPISANLLFERFANEARNDPPDIDVDFEHERREEVIQGIFKKYGRDRAGMVAAIHTYKNAGSYREICKAIGVDVGTLKADEVRSRFSELAKQYANRGVFVGTLTNEIADFPRHIGTHSGGFVITNDPLVETVPIEPAAMDGRTIIQWDKHDLETLGMMKIDILSIGFLTAIRKATSYLQMSWEDIPINDAKTYSLIQRAETAGCFQIESRAQMNSLPHTKPATPYEMTIQVALIRPSMSKGGMSRSYLRGRQSAKNGFPFSSGNVAMDKILGRTHGVAMFPDQIMQIAMDVCSWSAAQADQLRRSLGKERSAVSVDTQGQKLFKAMLENGIATELATDIMNRTQGFASYGFPEAHAASYGSLAFKSAYLKTHHPAEYLCGLINSQPMGFYRIDFLINEAVRNSGVRVLPVHPLKSIWDAQMEGDRTIRMGFRDIRKIREPDVEEMIAQRNLKRFDSIEDFIARTNFNKDVLSNLTISNAFECFGIDRRHSFWKSLAFKNLMGRTNDSLQLSLFDENVRIDDESQTFASMTQLEEAIIDYRTSGYSLKGSLMKQLRMELPHLPPTNSIRVRNLKRDSVIRCAGILLVDQRPPPAKGFGFITLEDEFGTMDLVLRPDVYDKYKDVFRSSRFLIVSGKIQRLDDHVTIKAETIESFALTQKVRSHQPTPRMLDRLDW